MASTIKQQFGTNNQAITCTFTSLANAAARQSTAIDNTTNLHFNAKIFIKAKTNASGTSATGVINIYIAETADGGTTYSENAGASDAAITLTAPPNVRLVGVLNAVANSTTYYGCFTAYDLPDHWVLIIENKSGATLDASIGSAWYQGVLAQGT